MFFFVQTQSKLFILYFLPKKKIPLDYIKTIFSLLVATLYSMFSMQQNMDFYSNKKKSSQCSFIFYRSFQQKKLCGCLILPSLRMKESNGCCWFFLKHQIQVSLMKRVKSPLEEENWVRHSNILTIQAKMNLGCFFFSTQNFKR